MRDEEQLHYDFLSYEENENSLKKALLFWQKKNRQKVQRFTFIGNEDLQQQGPLTDSLFTGLLGLHSRVQTGLELQHSLKELYPSFVAQFFIELAKGSNLQAPVPELLQTLNPQALLCLRALMNPSPLLILENLERHLTPHYLHLFQQALLARQEHARKQNVVSLYPSPLIIIGNSDIWSANTPVIQHSQKKVA
jgi:hypothetical protein